MNHKKEFSMNVGLPSILLIFVVLCLISFGVLSLVSANSDRKLSQKVLDRQTAYYNACNAAEENLYLIDQKLHNALVVSSNQDEYTSNISEIENHLSFPISDIQTLEISLEFIDPYSIYEYTNSDKLYKITSWKIITDDNMIYDSNLHLMDLEDI